MRFDGIREVRSGDEVRAADHNSLAAACRRNTPIQGPGIFLRQTPNGTVISARVENLGRAIAAPSSNHPFKLSYKTETSGGVTTYSERIYIPQGSVYVNGTNVPVTSQILTADTEADYYLFTTEVSSAYLHIGYTAASGSDPEQVAAVVSGTDVFPTMGFTPDDKWTFIIGSFDTAHHKVSAQLITGAVIINSNEGATFTPHVSAECL